jgi:hypothetical protein
VLELQGSESDLIILEEFKELETVTRCGLTIDEIGADTIGNLMRVTKVSLPTEASPFLPSRVVFCKRGIRF